MYIIKIAALLGIALSLSAAVWLARRRRVAASVVRIGLVAALCGFASLEVAHAIREGWFSWQAFLPLHLCDAAIVLAILALATRSLRLTEVLFFWAGAGSLPAILTPDLPIHAPAWEIVVFFSLHGLVVIAAGVLVFGLGLIPRPGAAWRVFLLTNIYAALVGIIDWLLTANYLYLRAKPEGRTLLDCCGPWPIYIFVCDALALILFHLIEWPLRSGGSRKR
jgi:hypothetical integral membrane protein (TIGR02206 family)